MIRALTLLLAASVGATVGCAPALPSLIRDEIAQTPPGVVTVVVFSDFACPYCRRTHALLARAASGRRVRIVLRHVPLPMHPDARGAARAAVCVERLAPDAAAPYADALFRAPQLTEAHLEELAVAQGVDRGAYQRCLTEPATDARIDQDVATFDALDGDGVPLLYVGRTRFSGMPSASALERALSSEPSSSSRGRADSPTSTAASDRGARRRPRALERDANVPGDRTGLR